MQIPLGLGYYVSDAVPYAAMTSTNVYPYFGVTDGAVAPAGLFRTSGLKLIENNGNTSGRGLHKYQKSGWLFYVAGDKLYKKVTLLGSAFEVGSGISGDNDVIMADNGKVLVIIAPSVGGWFYDIELNTFSAITDPVFLDFMLEDGGVTSVVEDNNRFIYSTDETFFIGSLFSVNSGMSFNALDYEDAESNSDPIVRVMEANNEVYVFNSESIELYRNIGGTDFPYQRVQNATTDIGLFNRNTIVKFNKQFIFLGRGLNSLPAIYTTVSGRIDKLSTPAIDSVIQNYTDIDLFYAKTWAYNENGADFIGFKFINETFVIDLTATAMAGKPIWHVRKSGSNTFRINQAVAAFNTTLVNDSFDARIGEMSREYPDEYGVPVTRSWRSLYLVEGTKPLFVSKATLIATRGVGSTVPSDLDYNPTINLKVSYDQTNTFHDMGNSPLGNKGTYNYVQEWRRLGRTEQSMILEFSISSPVKADFVRLDLDVGQRQSR